MRVHLQLYLWSCPMMPLSVSLLLLFWKSIFEHPLSKLIYNYNTATVHSFNRNWRIFNSLRLTLDFMILKSDFFGEWLYIFVCVLGRGWGRGWKASCGKVCISIFSQTLIQPQASCVSCKVSIIRSSQIKYLNQTLIYVIEIAVPVSRIH